ncbi:acyl-CoA thioesterase [uncultured Sphingomonas sp.]|uniref:acyl-CoA thioesterase n=1 Tax=uncultured Sphingomonas sp. TaxID=158754 RepID=UPI0035CC0BA9
MSFTTTSLVRFAHVDAAGIVFYPRYFEMLNAAIEDFFAQAVGADFASLHLDRGIGLPTASLHTEFTAPSRLGTLLEIEVTPTRLGRSSLALDVLFAAEGTTRLTVKLVIVCIALASGTSLAWPDDLRGALEPMVGP